MDYCINVEARNNVFKKIITLNPVLYKRYREKIQKTRHTPEYSTQRLEDYDWRTLSIRGEMSMDMIKKHHDKNLNWIFISRYQNLTMEIIDLFPNKSWVSTSNQKLDISL